MLAHLSIKTSMQITLSLSKIQQTGFHCNKPGKCLRLDAGAASWSSRVKMVVESNYNMIGCRDDVSPLTSRGLNTISAYACGSSVRKYATVHMHIAEGVYIPDTVCVVQFSSGIAART